MRPVVRRVMGLGLVCILPNKFHICGSWQSAIKEALAWWK